MLHTLTLKSNGQPVSYFLYGEAQLEIISLLYHEKKDRHSEAAR